MASIARFDFMRQGRQEDAEEFLGFFLNTLHDEASALLGKQPREALPPAKDDEEETPAPAAAAAEGGSAPASDWTEVGKKGKGSVVRQTGTSSPPSAISRLFSGSVRSTLTMPALAGSKPSISIEPFTPLQLDIQPRTVVSLETALKHLADPETIAGVTLASGRGVADAQRKTELETLPRVLVCHLKRFGWEEGARKMGKVVAFGEELEVPREAVALARRTATSPRYRLFGGASSLRPLLLSRARSDDALTTPLPPPPAVVYHHGPTVSSGHYTSAVLSRSLPSSSSAGAGDAPQWLHIDDDVVTPVDTADVCISPEQARAGQAGVIGGRERCAYLVFYERVD